MFHSNEGCLHSFFCRPSPVLRVRCLPGAAVMEERQASSSFLGTRGPSMMMMMMRGQEGEFGELSKSISMPFSSFKANNLYKADKQEKKNLKTEIISNATISTIP